MASIRRSVEGARGCGFRKKGGLYLVSGGLMKPCGKLPIELDICPCCGSGIKPSRGWTWIDTERLFDDQVPGCQSEGCSPTCPMFSNLGKAGLIWIGEKFYPTPEDWIRESQTMGVSRRIPAVPNDFKLGETFVMVAHRKAVYKGLDDENQPVYQSAIFHVFKPTAIEYIVTGDETEEELEKLEKRGLSLVDVVKKESLNMFEEE